MYDYVLYLYIYIFSYVLYIYCIFFLAYFEFILRFGQLFYFMI